MADATDSPEDRAFREEARAWLTEQLEGPFAHVRFRGGPGEEEEEFEGRVEWEKAMGAAGWTGITWPKEYGGRAVPLSQQVIFYQEYARAGGPGRVGHIGEGLVAPTILAFGTEEQKQRFLPGIKNGTELWCQGYSEPAAGSDLANVQTRARLEGNEWIIDGQKVWTSLAHKAGWCFVICKTEPDAPRYRNLSFLLVEMNQPGIMVKPIVQLSGTSEFNEVFFDGARTPAENIVGAPGQGWKVAMALLGFERGASTLGQQIGFESEFKEILAAARGNGAAKNPVMRQKLAQAWIELQLVRLNAVTNLEEGTTRPGLAAINKLCWATWHRDAGELAMEVMGADAELCAEPPYKLTRFQSRFLFSRSDTIYGGTNEIQRNIIAEQGLGLPREPRPDAVGKN
jgi:alkylation response protein AidB-like acyl-CoA dehydrogenase